MLNEQSVLKIILKDKKNGCYKCGSLNNQLINEKELYNIHKCMNCENRYNKWKGNCSEEHRNEENKEVNNYVKTEQFRREG